MRQSNSATARATLLVWCAHSTLARPTLSSSSSINGRSALCQSAAGKGDYGFNVFHNSNPQHGGSYARHERRMTEAEVEDFMLSVKGWKPVYEPGELNAGLTDASDDPSNPDAAASPGRRDDAPPTPSTLVLGEEAIYRTFKFATFGDAYLFMGRVWAFCYGSDKYPHVTWDGPRVTVYLYSPSFRGLSKRETRLAAFLNDQYNMLKKGKAQSKRMAETVAGRAAIEEVLGDAVKQALAEREALRRRPLKEATEGADRWEGLLKVGTESGGKTGESKSPQSQECQ